MLSSSTVFRGDTRWLIRRDLMEDKRSTIKTKCLRDNFATKQRQQLKTHNWQGIDYLIFISFEHIASRWPFTMKRNTFNEFINIKQKKRERRRIFRCCFVEIGSISSPTTWPSSSVTTTLFRLNNASSRQLRLNLARKCFLIYLYQSQNATYVTCNQFSPSAWKFCLIVLFKRCSAGCCW